MRVEGFLVKRRSSVPTVERGEVDGVEGGYGDTRTTQGRWFGSQKKQMRRKLCNAAKKRPIKSSSWPKKRKRKKRGQ